MAWGQYAIRGTLIDNETKQPVNGVVVTVDSLGVNTISNEKGEFVLGQIPNGPYQLDFELDNYVILTMDVEVNNEPVNLKTVDLISRPQSVGIDNPEDFIPTITLSDEDLEQELDNQNISGILSASRDVFVSAAAFTFGPMRFRIRGYDSENTDVLLNNIPFNDLEVGRVYWSSWGGLNDVTRNRDTDVGLGPIDYAFGGLGGATTIDTRASTQRKQIRLSSSLSNRSYNYRLMGTWSTGMLPSGWAISMSGTRRWAEEGFIEGTFYDSWSYFLSLDRKVGENHLFNFTGFASPTKRGRSAPSVQEAYDIAGTNFYNPNWGYQNGKKRNARVGDRHEPVFMLRHDWTISPSANLTTSIGYQDGKNSSTALDWFDAPDPRSDYYRYLPSFFLSDNEDDAAAIIFSQLQEDETNQQLNWDDFYYVNRNSQLTEKYAYLLDGKETVGNWSQYIIEDRHFDNTRMFGNVLFRQAINDQVSLQAGVTYQQQTIDSYKEVEDLLGGDFYVNVDKFAVRDSLSNPDAQQIDLDNPSEILQVGDRFGYDYESNIQVGSAWLQTVISTNNLDLFGALKFTSTQFWRTGKYRNGKFPENSMGDSEKLSFNNISVKAGGTYKFSGRHYLYANGMYMTRAPYMRNSFVSPRTRNQVVPDLISESIYGGEVGYIVRAPGVKGRATAYFTQIQDQVRILRFYDDFTRAFGNYVMNGVDQRHAGLELALETKITASLSLNAVAAIGQYIYNSRPTGSIYVDNAEVIGQQAIPFTIYQKNFYVDGRPQQAYTFGINYRSPKYWFANLNINHFRDIWMGFNPARRTTEAVVNLDPESEQFRSIIDQERADHAVTVDFFGGKSFKFGRNFLYLNVGVSNIFNKTDFRTGGFEQLRFDVRERDINSFPPRYFYSFGLNYFVNVSYRF